MRAQTIICVTSLPAVPIPSPKNFTRIADVCCLLSLSLVLFKFRQGDVSHFGHTNHHTMPCLADRFQLDAQVQHKLNYVRDHLPHATRVYLMGHSIGSYMMLRYGRLWWVTVGYCRRIVKEKFVKMALEVSMLC